MKHLFIVLAFLFSITLVRGEDNKVTIELVNGGNSFLKGEDIHLQCHFPINGTVNSVALQFEKNNFYFHDAKNQSNDKNEKFLKNSEIKDIEASTENHIVKVTIKNATQELQGEYICYVEFTDHNNQTKEEKSPKPLFYWAESLETNFHVYKSKDTKDSINSVEKGDPFVIECGADVDKLEFYAYKVTLLQENEPFVVCNVNHSGKAESVTKENTQKGIQEKDFSVEFKNSSLIASFEKSSEKTNGPFHCEYIFNIDNNNNNNKTYKKDIEIKFHVNSAVLLSFSFSLFALTLLSNFYSKIY